jgi:maleate isomerase
VPADRIVSFAFESFQGAGVDLVFASCTNFHALDAVARIEASLGVPAVTSNQAVLEAVLARFGLAGDGALPQERVRHAG